MAGCHLDNSIDTHACEEEKTQKKRNKSKQFYEKWFKSSAVATLHSTMTSIMNLKYAHISSTITKPFCSVSKMPEASHHNARQE